MPGQDAKRPFRAMNAVFTESLRDRKRFRDENGFLHITLRFLRTGILRYLPTPETFPDGVPPGAPGPDGQVAVLVEAADLRDPESLASLAGMPCLREHDWAAPDKRLDAVGSVAGSPEFDGEFVAGEAVITDAETISRLEAGELAEVSAAYVHRVDWEPGEFEGTPYAGKQREIRYNHFVLLPEGKGRCGPEVRVTNAKDNDMDKDKDKTEGKDGLFAVFSRKLKRLVYAQNADEAKEIAKADAEEEKPPEKEKSTDGNPEGKDGNKGGSEPEGIKNLDKLLAELEKVKARAAELEGQLAAAQEKINELLSTDKVEEEAEEINNEREEAATAMNGAGIPREKALAAFKEKKLRGHGLRVFAMNSIREAAGKAKLTEAQAKSEDFIRGMWGVVRETADQKKTVTGGLGDYAKAMNAYQDYRTRALNTLGFNQPKNGESRK
ncbi:MAG: DUF2213 domain-containing protein [Planctomycetota bacterium]|jgi:hypothetical protein|nr:DUF2213 domain-containing protein [Planctomycetota bacterium]